MELSKIKLNPDNPRLIRDEKLTKLAQSIKEFPAMMELRPIVVNSDMMILGGNMRYRACQELGMKEVPDSWVKIADKLNDDEQRRFTIEDNVAFGDWDWDVLKEWDGEELKEWGVDTFWSGSQLNILSDEDVDLTEQFDPVGISKDWQRVVFIFDGPTEAESYLKKIEAKYEKRNMAWQVNMTSQSI